MRRLVLMLTVLAAPALAAPAFAADGPWTPAPTPTLRDPGVQPAARAGTDSPSTVDTPFSSLPRGSVAANGATSSDVVNGVKTPDLTGK